VSLCFCIYYLWVPQKYQPLSPIGSYLLFFLFSLTNYFIEQTIFQEEYQHGVYFLLQIILSILVVILHSKNQLSGIKQDNDLCSIPVSTQIVRYSYHSISFVSFLIIDDIPSYIFVWIMFALIIEIYFSKFLKLIGGSFFAEYPYLNDKK
jgi:hypothetical protein